MRLFSTLMLGFASLLATPLAHAEPYFAQREGYKCSRCHVNRTGGGKRTPFGYQYGLTHLRLFSDARSAANSAGARGNGDGDGAEATKTTHDDDTGSSVGVRVDPFLNRSVSLGANMRLSHAGALLERDDGSRRFRGTFENREANLYAAVEMTPHWLAYADVSLAEGNTEAREVFMLLEHAGLHLKAGYLLLPFGLRIWGDEEFIRQSTGFTFAAPDIGLEVGYERGPFSAYAAVSNGAGGGPDVDRNKQFTGLAELCFPALRVGLSGSFNRTRNTIVTLGGLYAGITVGRLSLLGEADVVHTKYLRHGGETADSLLIYAEANLLVRRGLNAKIAYGYRDPVLEISEDQRMHVRAGVEVFPTPGLATALFYDLRASVPQDEVGNADVVFAEIHLYF